VSDAPVRFFDPTIYAGPVYLACILVERALLAHRRRRGDRRPIGYEWRDSLTSIFSGVVAPIAWFPTGLLTYAVALWCWDHRVATLGTGLAGWMVAMVGWDFSFYWQHRAEHEIRLLWGGHVTHHSSQRYNFSTALRQSWTPWTGFVFYPVWCVLGVHPLMVLMAGGFNLVYQFFLHTEAVDRLPAALEAWLNTPSHHRVHHGSNPQYLDRNYGGMLIVWDRLFGSFEPEGQQVVYGLTKNIHSYNPLWVQFHEYVMMARDAWNARSWTEALAYLFRVPGWKPENLRG